MQGPPEDVDTTTAMPSETHAAVSASALRRVEGLIEVERRRLNKADAILANLCVALDYADDFEGLGTQLSLAAESARDLVLEAMARLDVVNIEKAAQENHAGL